jgi:hypothetical protein
MLSEKASDVRAPIAKLERSLEEQRKGNRVVDVDFMLAQIVSGQAEAGKKKFR